MSELLATVTPAERHRLESGLTREEAALKSGLAERTIRRTEIGTAMPRFETIRKLARLYGVDPAVLLDETRRYCGKRNNYPRAA